MYERKIAILAAFLWVGAAAAQSAAPQNVQQAVDTMVRLCIAGGHTEASTVAGTGGADVSLRSLDIRGNLTGQFNINRSSAEGLVSGIDNALTQVAANQADKVRDCLKPVRERVLDLLLPAAGSGNNNAAQTQDFSVLGDVVNFGCERGAVSHATYKAPPGYRIVNAHADAVETSNTKSSSAKITSSSDHEADAEANFMGKDREFFNCPEGARGESSFTGR